MAVVKGVRNHSNPPSKSNTGREPITTTSCCHGRINVWFVTGLCFNNQASHLPSVLFDLLHTSLSRFQPAYYGQLFREMLNSTSFSVVNMNYCCDGLPLLIYNHRWFQAHKRQVSYQPDSHRIFIMKVSIASGFLVLLAASTSAQGGYPDTCGEVRLDDATMNPQYLTGDCDDGYGFTYKTRLDLNL